MITAIHGFLGRPSDWDFLKDAGFDLDAREMDDIPRRGDILLGYSMGGRLALHALLDGAKYKRAIIVSAGLGIDDPAERAARREVDEKWARRFASEDWDTVMRDWNAQPLFGGHIRMVPQDRDRVVKQLRDYSAARLPPLAPRLHEITIAVLWIAGERDSKYVEAARRAVGLLPDAQLWICPGAAHRVPWEKPNAFTARLRDFVQRRASARRPAG